jgi:hypothetical protein
MDTTDTSEKTYLVVMQIETDGALAILHKTKDQIHELAKTISKYDFCVIDGSVIKPFDDDLTLYK